MNPCKKDEKQNLDGKGNVERKEDEYLFGDKLDIFHRESENSAPERIFRGTEA